jgi:deazaflavin-dependent oxidoreductase (nitroreductase family)
MSTAEKVHPEVRTPPKPPPAVNRMMVRLLRSPLSRVVDRGILLLTVFGQRTGRPYTFPVQYVEADDRTLWVMSGAGAEKTWWRNLIGGAPVEVLLRRRRHRGRAVAFTYGGHPAIVEAELARYVERFGGMAKRLGITAEDEESLQRAAAATVMVRIKLDD